MNLRICVTRTIIKNLDKLIQKRCGPINAIDDIYLTGCYESFENNIKRIAILVAEVWVYVNVTDAFYKEKRQSEFGSPRFVSCTLKQQYWGV